MHNFAIFSGVLSVFAPQHLKKNQYDATVKVSVDS